MPAWKFIHVAGTACLPACRPKRNKEEKEKNKSRSILVVFRRELIKSLISEPAPEWLLEKKWDIKSHFTSSGTFRLPCGPVNSNSLDESKLWVDQSHKNYENNCWRKIHDVRAAVSGAGMKASTAFYHRGLLSEISANQNLLIIFSSSSKAPSFSRT